MSSQRTPQVVTPGEVTRLMACYLEHHEITSSQAKNQQPNHDRFARHSFCICSYIRVDRLFLY